MQLQCMLEAKDRELTDLRALLSSTPANNGAEGGKQDDAYALADREIRSLRRQVAELQGQVALLQVTNSSYQMTRIG